MSTTTTARPRRLRRRGVAIGLGAALVLLGVSGAIVASMQDGARTASSGEADRVVPGELAAGSVAAPAPQLDVPATEASAAASSEAAATASAALAAAPDEAGLGQVSAGDAASGLAGRLALGQRIAQTVSLRVRVGKGGLQGAVARATAIATGAGGYVLDATVDASPNGQPDRGTLTLRIPQGRVGPALDRLAALGRVTGQTIASEDLTQDYVDTTARLRHARAVEASLSALLDRATTVQDVLRVQDRLDGVQERIEVAKGRLDGLRAITDDATITLELFEPAVKAATVRREEPGDGLGITAAARRGAHAALDVTNGAIEVLVAAVPVVGMLAVAGGAVALVRRRRRLAASVASAEPAAPADAG